MLISGTDSSTAQGRPMPATRSRHRPQRAHSLRQRLFLQLQNFLAPPAPEEERLLGRLAGRRAAASPAAAAAAAAICCGTGMKKGCCSWAPGRAAKKAAAPGAARGSMPAGSAGEMPGRALGMGRRGGRTPATPAPPVPGRSAASAAACCACSAAAAASGCPGAAEPVVHKGLGGGGALDGLKRSMLKQAGAAQAGARGADCHHAPCRPVSGAGAGCGSGRAPGACCCIASRASYRALVSARPARGTGWASLRPLRAALPRRRPCWVLGGTRAAAGGWGYDALAPEPPGRGAAPVCAPRPRGLQVAGTPGAGAGQQRCPDARVSPPGPAIAASQIAMLEWRSVQRRRGDTGSVGALPSSNWHCRQLLHAARSAPPAPPPRLTLAGAVRLPGRAPRIRSPRSPRRAAR